MCLLDFKTYYSPEYLLKEAPIDSESGCFLLRRPSRKGTGRKTKKLIAPSACGSILSHILAAPGTTYEGCWHPLCRGWQCCESPTMERMDPGKINPPAPKLALLDVRNQKQCNHCPLQKQTLQSKGPAPSLSRNSSSSRDQETGAA